MCARPKCRWAKADESAIHSSELRALQRARLREASNLSGGRREGVYISRQGVAVDSLQYVGDRHAERNERLSDFVRRQKEKVLLVNPQTHSERPTTTRADGEIIKLREYQLRLAAYGRA